MIFDRLEKFTLHYHDGSEVAIHAPKGCHLRVTDAAIARGKREGDVIRVEEIQNGVVNVGADYLHTNVSWYETKVFGSAEADKPGESNG